MRKKRPLKWSMIKMLVLGWLLPLLIICLSLLSLVSSMIRKQVEKTILISTDKAVEICEMQMGAMINASKTASYNTMVRDSYVKYQKDGKGLVLSNHVKTFLNQQYKYDENFLCTMIFFLDNPKTIYYTYNTYKDNNSSNTGYDRVRIFETVAMEQVLETSKLLDTQIQLQMIDGHLYLIRNLVDSSYKPYGMIVMEIAPSTIMSSLESVWGAMEYEVFLDGNPILENQFAESIDYNTIRNEKNKARGYIIEEDLSYSYKVLCIGGQEFVFLVRLDSQTLIDDVAMLRYIIVVVLLFMIPLVMIIFWFFHVKVNKPVAALVDAAKEIKTGHYGHCVRGESNSQEFEYLDQAFNAMSAALKYQFEQIYLEELALKDANIMALQSQINPHFLNNTLEIINWEARMKGNEKVSCMIEALATMLNATMNRKQKRFISLEEELEYVEAYLYIICQRFGERFVVERNIDATLYPIEVPMLIIQPIVENAVEHGMSKKKKGMVRLHIYAKEDKMYMEIINDSALSEEDKYRIQTLLEKETQEQNEKHISMGIRNVDRRLRIIYGNECGLTIKSDNENQTISTIIVKINKDSNNSQ